MSDTNANRSLPIIVKVAVKTGAITRDQLKRALSIFDQETQEGKDTSIPEILVKTGMVSTKTMMKLHQLSTRYTQEKTTSTPSNKTKKSPSTEKPVDTDSGNVSIRVSDDKMTASLNLPRNQTLDMSAEDILDYAKSMGIVHGLVRPSTLMGALKQKKKR